MSDTLGVAHTTPSLVPTFVNGEPRYFTAAAAVVVVRHGSTLYNEES